LFSANAKRVKKMAAFSAHFKNHTSCFIDLLGVEGF
jgi:hypothetical protein